MPNIDIPSDRMDDPMGFTLTGLSPDIGPAANNFVRSVYQTVRLSLRVAEAARYRTALINGCVICQNFDAEKDIDAYLAIVGGDPATSVVARGGALPDDAFYAAVADWRNSQTLSEQERLAAELAERMGLSPDDLGYDEPFWARMRTAFASAEIADLVLAIGMWIAMGRFTHVLGLDTVCLPKQVAA